MKKLFLFLFSLLFLSKVAFCQSWQWGKKGGSSGWGQQHISPGGNMLGHTYSTMFGEYVVSMATDENNNIYVLSNMGSYGGFYGSTLYSLNVDGHYLPNNHGYREQSYISSHSGPPAPIDPASGGYGQTDILLTSFTCDGTYRWSKLIGGGGEDYGYSLGTDTLGHVYIVGRIEHAIGCFDVDKSFWPAHSTNKSIFIAQYDTAGSFKWFRMPQPDTMSYSNYYPFGDNYYRESRGDLNIMKNGDVYWLVFLSPGAYVNGNLIVDTAGNKTGAYVIKYDKSGNYTGAIPLDIQGRPYNFDNIQMQRDPLTGRFYVAGRISSDIPDHDILWADIF